MCDLTIFIFIQGDEQVTWLAFKKNVNKYWITFNMIFLLTSKSTYAKCDRILWYVLMFWCYILCDVCIYQGYVISVLWLWHHNSEETIMGSMWPGVWHHWLEVYSDLYVTWILNRVTWGNDRTLAVYLGFGTHLLHFEPSRPLFASTSGSKSID